MKFTVFTALALIAPLVALAAPAANNKKPFDGNSRCETQGFKVGPPKITECCLKNMGGSELVEGKIFKCKLPIGREGQLRKCIKDLGFATVTDCTYYDEEN
ncbi:hypothetical protein BGZ83_001856 [Gryganskiella cystojenkinii]|nr:hypothetical protein BGZ83_001856 [Gryganskiella cystojenkinii]